MHNYFVNMIFLDIQRELERVDALEENADLNMHGARLLLLVAVIVCPSLLQQIPLDAEAITPECLALAKEQLATEEFTDKFRGMCQMDVIPEIQLSQIKDVKAAFVDPWITNAQERLARLGNAGRLLSSWVDGVLEYTILKHEVVVLRLKSKSVLDRIQ